MTERKDRGIVLIAVLLMVAMMSVMVVAVTALTRSGIASQGLEQRRLASHLALRSGIESAKALILATPAERWVFFDGRPVTIDLGDGVTAEVTIRDAAGFVDLNRSDMKIVEAMLSASLTNAEAQTISARIADWRKKAEDKMKKDQPAQAQPAQTQPAQQPAGQQPAPADAKPQAAPVIFLSTDQLVAMAEPEEAGDLAGRFTVFNPTGELNPLAAPDDILLAVPGITPADLAAIAAARKSRAPSALTGLGQMVERLKPYLTIQPPSVFVVDVRLLSGTNIIPQSRAGTVTQVVDKGPLPFQTLWVTGS